MANNNEKDIANSLNKYTDYTHKGTDIVLSGAENINKWYAQQLNKIADNEVDVSRLETGVDNTTKDNNNINTKNEISTKVKQYNEIQTNQDNKNKIIKVNKIQTISEKDNVLDGNIDKNKTAYENNKKKLNITKKNCHINKRCKIN